MKTELREVGIGSKQFRRITVNSNKEFKDTIKKYHGTVNLYETVFTYKYKSDDGRPVYNTAIIDKLFFDLDSDNSLENIKKFHLSLLKQDIKHCLVQSSYLRFYVLPETEIDELDNKKAALLGIMKDLADKAGLTYGDAHSSDLDITSFGDVSRLMAVVGTWKTKRNNWVSYLKSEDLGDIKVLEHRTKFPLREPVNYGNKFLSLKPFDCEPEIDYSKRLMALPESDFEFEFNDKAVEILPPFLKKILTNYKGYGDNYSNRWRVVIYMRDKAYPRNAAEKICQEYFSKIVNHTTLKGEGSQWDRMVDCDTIGYVYNNRDRYQFPWISTLLNEGYEITKEDNELMEKLYGRN